MNKILDIIKEFCIKKGFWKDICVLVLVLKVIGDKGFFVEFKFGRFLIFGWLEVGVC